MGNSTIKLQSIVDDGFRMGDIAPALASGGSSNEPALSIANDVITDMINGTPDGNPFNWKWNRFQPASFLTISHQQDYAGNSTNIGYLEDCYAVDINNTTTGLKPRRPVEV